MKYNNLKWKILTIIFILSSVALYYSPFYYLDKKFGGNSLKESIYSSINSFKNRWAEYILTYGSLLIIGLLGTFLHFKILKKKGIVYNILSLLAIISIIYLGIAIFFQSIDGLKLMYTENFKLWCFTIVCIVICIYYFLIEKDIFS